VKVWAEVKPNGDGDFVFQPGERYAVLASVSKNFTVEQVVKYLAGKGFDVTYSWEQGDDVRRTGTKPMYDVDAWLLTVEPDARENHRWIYGEGNFDGAAPWTVGQNPPSILFVHITVYHVAHVMQAVDGPPNALPSTAHDAPAPEPSGKGVGPLALLGVALVGGALVARGRSRR
jgi:hypothetical protein